MSAKRQRQGLDTRADKLVGVECVSCGKIIKGKGSIIQGTPYCSPCVEAEEEYGRQHVSEAWEDFEEAPHRLTYGKLPTRKQFESNWWKHVGGDELFEVSNDPYQDGTFSESEMWDALNEIVDHKTGDEDAMDWASAVLGLLGIEWV